MEQKARDLMQLAFRNIADNGSVDSGSGMGQTNFWLSIDGVEYYVTVVDKGLRK